MALNLKRSRLLRDLKLCSMCTWCCRSRALPNSGEINLVSELGEKDTVTNATIHHGAQLAGSIRGASDMSKLLRLIQLGSSIATVSELDNSFIRIQESLEALKVRCSWTGNTVVLQLVNNLSAAVVTTRKKLFLLEIKLQSQLHSELRSSSSSSVPPSPEPTPDQTSASRVLEVVTQAT